MHFFNQKLSKRNLRNRVSEKWGRLGPLTPCAPYPTAVCVIPIKPFKQLVGVKRSFKKLLGYFEGKNFEEYSIS